MRPERNVELDAIDRLRGRLFDCLNRHVRAEDEDMSDRRFVFRVFQRWAEEVGAHLGDPGDGVILEQEA